MEISQRIKGLNGETIGILVADTCNIDDRIVTIGISLCNKLDKFDMDCGKILANNRRYNFNDKVYIKNRNDDYMYSVKDQAFDFLHRCYRYYKDKSIIMPKIIWTYRYHKKE